MNLKYYVIWHDNEDSHAEQFEEVKEAEERVNEIMRLSALGRSGVKFDCCIYGKRLRLDAKEVSVVYVMREDL